ncbi:hypothetical protein LEP1GSC123_2716 [Leptospira borgpetersenii str. 200701203]|uniref:Uncharacterized protein n=1 Tax=Leptospira borgpetersenii str. 200701203 TaxID=1193007 RepID=M3HWX1_LEPBO|nr:hypothetical protein LEP1GSC123_2716 [Leptospira borgpetersenii str. 200701203]
MQTLKGPDEAGFFFHENLFQRTFIGGIAINFFRNPKYVRYRPMSVFAFSGKYQGISVPQNKEKPIVYDTIFRRK